MKGHLTDVKVHLSDLKNYIWVVKGPLNRFKTSSNSKVFKQVEQGHLFTIRRHKMGGLLTDTHTILWPIFRFSNLKKNYNSKKRISDCFRLIFSFVLKLKVSKTLVFFLNTSGGYLMIYW